MKARASEGSTSSESAAQGADSVITYPNYSRGIPPEPANTSISLSAKELHERASAVAMFARDSVNVVRIRAEVSGTRH
jgi:hypothetical protein